MIRMRFEFKVGGFEIHKVHQRHPVIHIQSDWLDVIKNMHRNPKLCLCIIQKSMKTGGIAPMPHRDALERGFLLRD